MNANKSVRTSRYTCLKGPSGGWLVYDKMFEKNRGSYKVLPDWIY